MVVLILMTQVMSLYFLIPYSVSLSRTRSSCGCVAVARAGFRFAASRERPRVARRDRRDSRGRAACPCVRRRDSTRERL